MSVSRPITTKVFVRAQDRFPWASTLSVAIGAIALFGGILGCVQPNGALSFIAQKLKPSYFAIPLTVGGGALLLFGASALCFRSRGNRGFRRASLVRVIAHVARIPLTMYRTSQMKKMQINKFTTRDIKNSHSIKNMGCRVDPQTVVEYGRKLVKGKADYQYLYPAFQGSSSDLEKKFYLLDLVLDGAIDSHVVTVKVDTVTKNVEYYDSCGLSINDRANTKVRGTDKTLSNYLESFVKEVRDDQADVYTVTENSKRYQSDHHSCGLHVSMKKREWLQGGSYTVQYCENDARQTIINAVDAPQDTCNYDDGNGNDF